MLWAKSEQGAIWGEAREDISHRHVARGRKAPASDGNIRG